MIHFFSSWGASCPDSVIIFWRNLSGQRDHFLAKSLESLQENIRRSGPAATASYTLVGAVLLLGGIGYLLDQWLMTSPWFLLGGLLFGMVVGFYEIAKAVWKR